MALVQLRRSTRIAQAKARCREKAAAKYDFVLAARKSRSRTSKKLQELKPTNPPPPSPIQQVWRSLSTTGARAPKRHARSEPANSTLLCAKHAVKPFSALRPVFMANTSPSREARRDLPPNIAPNHARPRNVHSRYLIDRVERDHAATNNINMIMGACREVFELANVDIVLSLCRPEEEHPLHFVSPHIYQDFVSNANAKLIIRLFSVIARSGHENFEARSGLTMPSLGVPPPSYRP